MFKDLMNLGNVLRQASQMGGKLKEAQERLRTQRAHGSAAGGLVHAEVSGGGELVRLSLAEGLVAQGDRAAIETHVVEAVNQALAAAKELQMQAMQSATDGVDMSGVNSMLSKFTGAGEAGTK